MAHKRRNGERVSHEIPLGYDLAGDGVLLIENREEKAVIDRIVELRNEGLSSRRIIVELDARGIQPKRGGRWHPKVVLEICSRATAPDENRC